MMLNGSNIFLVIMLLYTAVYIINNLLQTSLLSLSLIMFKPFLCLSPISCL